MRLINLSFQEVQTYQVGGMCPECGDETMDHADNDALDQLASKFTFQKQALAALVSNPVFAHLVK